MNETTTADYLQLPDFPPTYPAPVSFVLRKLEMVRSELVRMINEGSALTGVVMSVNGKAPDESKNVSLAASDVPATEKVDGVDVQTTVQARLDATASGVSGLSSRVATLEGKTVEDPLVLGKAGDSQAKMSSEGGFSHVVPKTLDGTVFSDEATVSAGGVKLTSHELEEYSKEVSVEVVSESAPSSMFFRRCAVNAVGTGITGFPYAEGTDGTGDPGDLFNVTPTRFTLDVSGLFHNDGGRVVDDRGHEDALVRAVYNATGAMFIQPDVDGHNDKLDSPYVRRNEVTADGVYLVKPNYTYETSSILTESLFYRAEDVDRFVASTDYSAHNNSDNILDPYFYYKDRHGMPTMLHNFRDGHDYANLTAARLLFRRDEAAGPSCAVFGGMSAEMVKFYGDPTGISGPDVDDLEHSSALSSQWLRVQRYDEDADREEHGGYVYSRVEADGLTVGNSVSDILRTTVKMGEMRLTRDGGHASLTPTELKLYTDVSEATATMTPTELKLYLVGCDTPYIAVGTEGAADRTYAEDTGLDGGYQAFIRAPGGLMLRIGSSELYLTGEKLNTLSSVLDGYSALQEKVEALEKALAGAVSATVSDDEKTLTLGTITPTETKSDAAETTAGA